MSFKASPSFQETPASSRWLRWALVPLAVAVVAILVWAHYGLLTSQGGYANEDFMGLWSGGRAVLEGLDPYDTDDWISLRRRYGSTWMPDARCPLPLWTCLFLLPFSALSLDWGAACWLVFCEALVGLCCYLLMTTFMPRRPTLLEFLFVVLGAFAFRPTVTNLINGQLTLVPLLALTLFLVWEKRGHELLAGLALALIALKPNAFLLFGPLILIWLIWRRRWRIVVSAGAGGLTMMLVTWLVQPGWLFKWLTVRGKTEATFKTPTIWGIAHDLSFAWWPLIGLAAAAAFTAALGWFVLVNKRLGAGQVVPLVLGVSLAIVPYVWSYEHALLLLPLVLLFAWVDARKLAWSVWVCCTFLVPWALYWVAIQRDRDTLSVLVPLLVSVVFYVLVVRQARADPTPAGS